MSIFDNVRLPIEVEQGSYGGPNFQTTIIGMSSGFEQTNIDWPNSRAAYTVTYGIDSVESYQEVQSFFYARRGKGRPFRFRDWSDYQCTLEPIGNTAGTAAAVGDGANHVFQLIKTYEPAGPNPYIRRITRPDLTETFSIFINGVLQLSSAYTITGTPPNIITFGTAPIAAAVILVTCSFDVPVRFDTDVFSVILQPSVAGAVDTLPIVEIRE